MDHYSNRKPGKLNKMNEVSRATGLHIISSVLLICLNYTQLPTASLNPTKKTIYEITCKLKTNFNL